MMLRLLATLIVASHCVRSESDLHLKQFTDDMKLITFFKILWTWPDEISTKKKNDM